MTKSTFTTALFVAILVFASHAFAMDLAQARSSGLVGEKLDGYAAVVGSNSAAQSVVTDVNTRRRAEYEKISKQNGQPVSVVAKLAAEQIINGLPAGALYQGTDGSWKKK
jgi:uncharacterized protein YdbL (DUF1318 family)